MAARGLRGLLEAPEAWLSGMVKAGRVAPPPRLLPGAGSRRDHFPQMCASHMPVLGDVGQPESQGITGRELRGGAPLF